MEGVRLGTPPEVRRGSAPQAVTASSHWTQSLEMVSEGSVCCCDGAGWPWGPGRAWEQTGTAAFSSGASQSSVHSHRILLWVHPPGNEMGNRTGVSSAVSTPERCWCLRASSEPRSWPQLPGTQPSACHLLGARLLHQTLETRRWADPCCHQCVLAPGCT